MFKLGYNTNGFASHSLLSAIDIIGSLGYDAIAITIDHHALNPWDDRLEDQISLVKTHLNTYQLSCMIETGARFLLDPGVKHEPTLISKDKKKRNLRTEFIEKCLHIASRLGADAVSIWSGNKKEGVDEPDAWDWLVSGCHDLCKKASDIGVVLGFEPEPGMFVENMAQYQRLKERVNHECFKLTLDLGHAFITEKSVVETLNTYRGDIVNIHLEDMKKNRHDHLFFGDGHMDFKPIFQTLDAIAYRGQVNIELSRHSHAAVETAQKAIQFADIVRAQVRA